MNTAGEESANGYHLPIKEGLDFLLQTNLRVSRLLVLYSSGQRIYGKLHYMIKPSFLIHMSTCHYLG